MLRQRLVEREQAQKGNSGQATTSQTETHLSAPSTLAITQGKDALVVIQPEATTSSDFDSAIGGLTRSSRASQSDVEFSESYL